MDTLTRAELYKLVWSEPIMKIAPRLGLSDRGLGKLCARHDIPVPPRGYWARKAVGKRDRQPPLPHPERNETIAFDGPRPEAPATQTSAPLPLPPEIEFERDPVNFVFVEPHGRLTHPLVSAAAKSLKAQPPWRGIVRRIDCLDIRVSKGSLSRALHIMQALLAALEARGHSVTLREKHTEANVLGEKMNIFLRERLQQRIRGLTHEERRRRRDGGDVDPYELVPTGDLSLHIDHSHDASRAADGKTKRLEDCLNTFIEAMLENAFNAKSRRAYWEADRARRAEAERVWRQHVTEQRQAEAQIERFEELLRSWQQSQDRRAFLKELRDAIGTTPNESPLSAWLTWAEDWVRDADPLERFRNRGETIRVYFAAYSHQVREVQAKGFRDPEHSDRDDKQAPAGVELCDEPDTDSGNINLEIELPEDTLLPYETTEPGYSPRTFCVPARVLNSQLAATTGHSDTK